MRLGGAAPDVREADLMRKYQETRRNNLVKQRVFPSLESDLTFSSPSMFPVNITKSCNGCDGKNIHDVEVRATYKSLLRYLIRIVITINPSCEPRERRVNYDMTVMISCVTG